MEDALNQVEAVLRTEFDAFMLRVRGHVDGLLASAQQERDKGLAEVAAKRAELQAEIDAMGSLKRSQDSQVVLSVGGRRFHTSTAMLRSKPGTMLAAMFSGRYGMERDDDGSVFIDRDGRYFQHVLSFLRDDDVGAEDLGVAALRQLKREFAYYGI